MNMNTTFLALIFMMLTGLTSAHVGGGKTHKGGPPGIAEEVQVYDDDSWYWDDGYCGGSYKWTCGSSGCGWECITSGDQESLDNEKGEDSDGKIPKYLRSVIS